MEIFENSKLMISARSPFARRVRLCFLEHKVAYEEQIVDVFHPPKDFELLNPVMRIPVSILSGGRVIVDSNSILDIFYRGRSQSPLISKTVDEAVTAAFWSGVALGICESTVQFYLETLRNEKWRSPDFLEEHETNIKNGVHAFEKFLGARSNKKQSTITSALTQADLDIGTALAYLSIRHSWDWGNSCPETKKYLEEMNRRPAFQATVPPKA